MEYRLHLRLQLSVSKVVHGEDLLTDWAGIDVDPNFRYGIVRYGSRELRCVNTRPESQAKDMVSLLW